MGVRSVAAAHIRRSSAAPISFADFAISPLFCRLDLPPLVEKLALAADGLPIAAPAKHFGCDHIRGATRRTVVVRSGGRGGKTSRLLAPKALHAAWTVPLPTLRPGERARSLLVAPDLKLARQALDFVRGYVEESSVLRDALVGDPTKDGLVLRRPDGQLVAVEVLAATRGGRAVRARTLVFAGLDEAAFFFAEGTGVVTDRDIYNAVFQRIVPGGQVWVVSTPWLQGVGLLEEKIAAEWGRHVDALVCSAGTRALNPTWDPDGSIERTMRADDPDAARREIDGEPLAGGAASFFEPAAIDLAVDKDLALPLRPRPGDEVCAGADLGFRSDASAGCVTYRRGREIVVADLLELRPGAEPLKPSAVVRQLAEMFKTHAGCSYVVADGHYREAFAELLSGHELSYKDAPAGSDGVSSAYLRTRSLLREGRIRIPNHPRLLAQLRAVEWRPNVGGSISILLPRERMGGHCDLVSAFVLAVWESAGLEVPEDEPEHKAAWRAHWEHGRVEDPLEAKVLEDMDRDEAEEKWWR